MPEPIRFDELPSTQDEALRLAREGAEDGTIVVAGKQTAGRGQRDNSWHGPEGGLYASIIVRDIPNPRMLTLAIGNAVANVVEVAGGEPQLKWVNDVLVDGKKIAGILVDGEFTGDKVDFLVAGIGINVNGSVSDFPSELQATSTTLEEVLGAENCIEDLETFLWQEIAGQIELLRAGANDEVMQHWETRDYLQGKQVQGPDGEAGIASGIDINGALLLDVDGDRISLQNGPVQIA